MNALANTQVLTGSIWASVCVCVSIVADFLTGVLLAGKLGSWVERGANSAGSSEGLLYSRKFTALRDVYGLHGDVYGLQWVCGPGGLQTCSYVLLFAFHSKLLRL